MNSSNQFSFQKPHNWAMYFGTFWSFFSKRIQATLRFRFMAEKNARVPSRKIEFGFLRRRHGLFKTGIKTNLFFLDALNIHEQIKKHLLRMNAPLLMKRHLSYMPGTEN
jgi:hypothetical protein